MTFVFLVGCVYFEERVLSLRMHTDLRKKNEKEKSQKVEREEDKSKSRNIEMAKSQKVEKIEKKRKVEQYTF